MESENVTVGRRVPWNKGKFTEQKPPLNVACGSVADFHQRRLPTQTRSSSCTKAVIQPVPGSHKKAPRT